MGNGARWPHDAILHAWWVEPGRLLAGEYPGAKGAREGAQKLRLLVDAGVDSIIDLTTPARRARVVPRCTGSCGRRGRTPGPSLRPPHSGHERDRPRWLRRDSCSHPRRNQLLGESFTSTAGAVRAAPAPWSAAFSSTTGWTTRPRSRASPSCEPGPERPATPARNPRPSIGCFESAQLGVGGRESCNRQRHPTYTHTPCRSRCRGSCSIRASRAMAEYPVVAEHSEQRTLGPLCPTARTFRMLRKTKVEQARVSAVSHARMAAATQHPWPISGKLRPPTVERESVRRGSCRRPSHP